MRELIVNTFLTLDGVTQAPGGPGEDPSGGFEQGGWMVGYWDEQVERAMGEWMSKPFDLVLGRKIYENDDRRAPDARDGLRDRGAQHELSAPGFPADLLLRGDGEVYTATSTRR
ncbi:MAG: hypothetical protein ACRDNR_12385 [Gaiellaceae bacterium]